MIGLAQLGPSAGDIAHNTEKHFFFIHEAQRRQATAVFFSELSLTGYEPTLAQKLAFSPNDPRLTDFQSLSDKLTITLGIGLPLRVAGGIQIAMAIFTPNHPLSFYAKQFLHTDEEPYFIPGTHPYCLDLGDYRLGLAICYESLLPKHVESCQQLGANFYLASVAKHHQGMTNAYPYYASLARTHRMPVAVVNAVGPSDDFVCGGQTAYWDVKGNLVGKLDDKEEGVLMVELT